MNRIFARWQRSAMLGAMSKRSESVTRRREIVRGQADSGLSVAAYCRRAGVSLSSFYAWRRKLRDAATFAEVRFTSAAPVDAAAFEVRLPGGRCLVVRPGFDQQTLLELVAALERGDGDAATREVGV